MRVYLSSVNFCKAILLGGVSGLMSVPWIMIASPRLGIDPGIRLIASFFIMILLAGAGTAWGGKGGMIGIFPGCGRMLAGVGIGAGLAVPLMFLCIFLLDPVCKDAFRLAGGEDLVLMHYPVSRREILAIVLWVMSFEVMLFQVGVMSFSARIFNSMWIAVAIAVLFAVYIEHRHMLLVGLESGASVLVGCFSAVSGFSACVLFAKFGFPGAVVFAGLMSARLFLL